MARSNPAGVGGLILVGGALVFLTGSPYVGTFLIIAGALLLMTGLVQSRGQGRRKG